MAFFFGCFCKERPVPDRDNTITRTADDSLFFLRFLENFLNGRYRRVPYIDILKQKGKSKTREYEDSLTKDL